MGTRGTGPATATPALLMLLVVRASVSAAESNVFTNCTQEMVVRMYADSELDQRMLVAKNTFESKSTSTFGVGFSEFYGAGGSAVLGHGGERTQLQLNKLYPGHGATGEWVMQQQEVSVKVHVKVTVEVHDNTLELVLARLQASAFLRDNMVTVFGYVLHLPDNPLPSPLYTSLFYLYTDVRYRRVHTVELVGVLQQMAFEPPHHQFLILFRQLRKIIPQYLTGAVDVWIEALEKRTIDMDKLLRPITNDPLKVDFLAGIEPSVLPVLTQVIRFPPQAHRSASAESRSVVGPTLSVVMGAVAAEVLPLTQQLFALILVHRPVNDMIPQREETERYIVDVLRLGNVGHWDQVRKAVRGELKKGAYAVGRAVLYKIYTMKSVDPLIRMKARYILQYMKPPVATYSNPNYEVSSQILSTPSINILKILSAITHNEHPKEVVEIRSRLEHYILKGYISIEFVIKGFNRFDHVRPVNILIAVLTRIEVRLSKLPTEIISSVKYLKQVLTFKKYLSNLNPMVPMYLTDIETLLNGFSGPAVPRRVTHTVRELVELLPVDEPLPWVTVVRKTSVRDCSLPRLCLLNVFRRIVVAGTAKHRHLEASLTRLIKMLDYEGNPLPEYIVSSGTVLKQSNTSVETLKVSKWKLAKPLHITSETEFIDLQNLSVSSSSGVVVKDIMKYSNHSTTELISQFTKAEQPELLYSPSKTTVIRTKAIYPGPTVKIMFTPISDTVLNAAVDDIRKIHLVLPVTRVGTPEDIFLRPVRLLLAHSRLYEFLGPNFNPRAYNTKGLLLKAVLRQSGSLKFVQFNKVLHSSIIRYVQFLENSNSMKVIVDDSVPFPMVPPKFYEQLPNYNNLLSLLPMVRPSSPQFYKLKPLVDLLSDQHLPNLLGSTFDVTKYRSKGHLIIAILRRSMRLQYVRTDSVKVVTIKKYIEHVEDSMWPQAEVIRAPFPALDPLFEEEPAPHLHFEAVLPVTEPGTAVHVRLRPLRRFLSRPNIRKVFSGLKVTRYVKKGALLRAIVKHSLTLSVVRRDAQLHTVIRDYWAFLSKSVTTREVTMNINGKTLIHSLPPPTNRQEEVFLRVIKHYISTVEFHNKVSRVVNFRVHRTRGVAFKLISEALTKSSEVVRNRTVYEAFMYYKKKVQLHGYGAQAVDVLVTHQPIRKFKFEVYSLFRAVDHGRLTVSVKESVRRIIKFMTSHFEPSVYLHGFEPTMYHTKGNFLQGLFQTLLVRSAVRPEIKADIVHVLPFILSTGPGAEPVGIETTKLGHIVHVISL